MVETNDAAGITDEVTVTLIKGPDPDQHPQEGRYFPEPAIQPGESRPNLLKPGEKGPGPKWGKEHAALAIPFEEHAALAIPFEEEAPPE